MNRSLTWSSTATLDETQVLETRLVVRGSDVCGVILPQGNGQARGNEVPGAMLP
jgi:hypothetical protein